MHMHTYVHTYIRKIQNKIIPEHTENAKILKSKYMYTFTHVCTHVCTHVHIL
jgi:hypothetical protein